jgi:hypothetical protein
VKIFLNNKYRSKQVLLEAATSIYVVTNHINLNMCVYTSVSPWTLNNNGFSKGHLAKYDQGCHHVPHIIIDDIISSQMASIPECQNLLEAAPSGALASSFLHSFYKTIQTCLLFVFRTSKNVLRFIFNQQGTSGNFFLKGCHNWLYRKSQTCGHERNDSLSLWRKRNL